jgi:hypothetical protein
MSRYRGWAQAGRVQQGVAGPARRAADKGDDVERLEPGIVRTFAELDDALAPTGDGFDLRQRLEIQPADEIKQRLVFCADAGEFHSLVTKTAQEQRTRRIEAVEPGNIKRARGPSSWAWLRPLLQGIPGFGEHGYSKRTR